MSETHLLLRLCRRHRRLTRARAVKWLANAGIVPSHSQTYSTSAFLAVRSSNARERSAVCIDWVRQAMSSGLGGPSAMIKCSEMSGGRAVINNFAVCVSKTLDIQDCPDALIQQWQESSHCGDQVGYPVIPH